MAKIFTRRVLFLLVIFSVFLGISACRSGQTAHFNGYIEGEYTYVSAPVSGKLLSLNVRRGNKISENTLLFKLDKNPENFAQQQTLATLNEAKFSLVNETQPTKRLIELNEIKALINQARANLDYYQSEVQRKKVLAKSGNISQQGLDQAIQQFNIYKAQLKQYQAQLAAGKLPLGRDDAVKAQNETIIANKALLDKATWMLSQKTVRAPIAGTVFDTYFRVGEQVAQYQPVVSLLAAHNIKALFFIPEPALSQVKLGQIVYLTCDTCEKNLQATISFISPQAEYTPPVIYSERTRSKLIFRVEARLNAKSAIALHPGQPVNVFFRPQIKKSTA